MTRRPLLHRRGDAGFTIIEMLVSSLIMLVVTGAVFTLMNPAQGTFKAQPEVSDLQQRLRIGVDTLQKDLVMAGAGTYNGQSAGALSYFIAPVMPYHAFGDTTDPENGSVLPDRRDQLDLRAADAVANHDLSADASEIGGDQGQLPAELPAQKGLRAVRLQRGRPGHHLRRERQLGLFRDHADPGRGRSHAAPRAGLLGRLCGQFCADAGVRGHGTTSRQTTRRRRIS